MDMPAERAPEGAATAFEADPDAAAAPLGDAQTRELHRAINERRARLENAEMLRRLRSL